MMSPAYLLEDLPIVYFLDKLATPAPLGLQHPSAFFFLDSFCACILLDIALTGLSSYVQTVVVTILLSPMSGVRNILIYDCYSDNLMIIFLCFNHCVCVKTSIK